MQEGFGSDPRVLPARAAAGSETHREAVGPQYLEQAPGKEEVEVEMRR